MTRKTGIRTRVTGGVFFRPKGPPSFGLLTGALALFVLPLGAQDSNGQAGGGGATAATPELTAHSLGESVRIDGLLEEAGWLAAMVADNFVQFTPDEGAPASQRTEARVMYGEDALFVGIRAWDTAPDSIVAQLARRDQEPYSDWVSVAVDSYHDRRTAFHFMVNPMGVKRDTYRFDDSDSDDSWDAVWEVATSRDERGWTAEFKIPYSQLRFDGGTTQTWGINFSREIARHQEESVWAPITREQSGIVSQFGTLTGLRGIQPPRRLEVLPYSLVRMQNAPGDPSNPFYDSNAFSSRVGADLKYGITSDITLDLTINPDFGQVEADPGQVNLSAFESFFPEQRPFFIEGANIFAFPFSGGDGDMASEGLFYSRRIGRRPHGSAPSSASYAEVPEQTNILGAMKISGKTASGWSLGFLHGVTGTEEADLASDTGPLEPVTVEPLTNYGVGRVQRDFREGKSAVGMITTWTSRSREAANELALHTGAYTGGVDFRHRFGDDNFAVSGYLLGSHVRGSTDAIERTQRAPARYFQRPDAGHVDVDPARTSLSGWSGSATFSKIGGGYWRYATGLIARSPGFAANDLGFMREADFVSPFLWIGYQHFRPTTHLRRWNLNLNGWSGHNFDGDRQNAGGNVNGSVTFNNYWSAYAGAMRQLSGLQTTLRGGPLLAVTAGYGGWFGFNTDSRKAVQINVNNNFNLRPESDSWNYNTSANLRWRPSSQAQVSFGPFLNRREGDLQWVRKLDLEDPAYVFARIDQTTMGLTARMDWTFTPNLSLQVYAQPFVASGAYDEYKVITESRAANYTDRFRLLSTTTVDGNVEADVDGDGTTESFSAPDFTFAQFRSNAVLRWEYQPGSALFLVWSQGRDFSSENGQFDVGRNLDTLFGTDGEDILMLKLSYWLG